MLAVGGRFGTLRGLGGYAAGSRQPASTTAAHLPPSSSGRTGLVRCPLVGRALFVRRPATLACDLALLFGRHRRESSSFFAFCNHHSASCMDNVRPLPIRLRWGVLDWGWTGLVERGLRRFVRIRIPLVTFPDRMDSHGPRRYQSLCRASREGQAYNMLLYKHLEEIDLAGVAGGLQRFATEGLHAVVINCADEVARPRLTLPAGARIQAGGRRLRRRRSLPCAWRRGPAPLSAKASAGTR